MIDSATALTLFQYNAWADGVLFDAISALPADTPYKKTPTLFGSMLGTLNHNLQVDLIWRAHMLGQQHGFTTRRDLLHPGFSELVRAQTEMNTWFIDWAGNQSSQSLARIAEFRYVSGQSSQLAIGAMVLHIVNHKTYHRGWVSEMFFHAGAPPPETDFCIYMRDVHESGGRNVSAKQSTVISN